MALKNFVKSIISKSGYNITKKSTSTFPIDYATHEIEIIKMVKPYTMTSHQRIQSLIRSVEYIIQSNVGGDFVECGVWKGGSIMTIALTLKRLKTENRDIFLYDTFSGMSTPTGSDVDWHGKSALKTFNELKTNDGSNWCRSSIDEVKNNILTTNYPQEKIHYVQGKVEETLRKFTPEKIALLRLDTDFYESTKSEMEHLFPKLTEGGILIIDDYGAWKGSRLAIDEYFEKNNLKLFLNRIDETGRLAVKID